MAQKLNGKWKHKHSGRSIRHDCNASTDFMWLSDCQGVNVFLIMLPRFLSPHILYHLIALHTPDVSHLTLIYTVYSSFPRTAAYMRGKYPWNVWVWVERLTPHPSLPTSRFRFKILQHKIITSSLDTHTHRRSIAWGQDWRSLQVGDILMQAAISY